MYLDNEEMYVFIMYIFDRFCDYMVFITFFFSSFADAAASALIYLNVFHIRSLFDCMNVLGPTYSL